MQGFVRIFSMLVKTSLLTVNYILLLQFVAKCGKAVSYLPPLNAGPAATGKILTQANAKFCVSVQAH